MNYYDIKPVAKTYLLNTLNLLNIPNPTNIHTIHSISMALAKHLYITLQPFQENDIDMLIIAAKRTTIYTLNYIDIVQQTESFLLSQGRMQKLDSLYMKTCILAVYLYIAILEEPEVSVVLELQDTL